MLKPIGPALADVVAKAKPPECPIPFPYAIRTGGARRVELTIDADLAEIIDAKRTYVISGPDAWGDAVKLAQKLRGEFEESWRDAHCAPEN